MKAVLEPGGLKVFALTEAESKFEPAKNERSAFRTLGQTKNVNRILLYKLFNERYTVYWRVNSKTA